MRQEIYPKKSYHGEAPTRANSWHNSGDTHPTESVCCIRQPQQKNKREIRHYGGRHTTDCHHCGQQELAGTFGTTVVPTSSPEVLGQISRQQAAPLRARWEEQVHPGHEQPEARPLHQVPARLHTRRGRHSSPLLHRPIAHVITSARARHPVDGVGADGVGGRGRRRP